MKDQRRGKIARLPRSIRDELNVRLDDGQDANQILPWLNGLHEVREVLARHFNGAPISRQNLSAWRQGGFNEWLLFQQFLESAERMQDNAEVLNERLGSDCAYTVPRKLADNMLTHLSIRMAAFIAGWDGAAFSPEMEVLLNLSQYIIKLQRAICQTERHDLDRRRASHSEPRERSRILGEGATFSEYLEWMGLKKPQKPKPTEQVQERAKNKAANRASSLESQSKPVKAGQGSPANRAESLKSTEPPIVEYVAAETVTQTDPRHPSRPKRTIQPKSSMKRL